MTDTEPVTVSVLDVRKASDKGKLLALVDVAITIHGIEFKVQGLRVARGTIDGKPATSVTSPQHRGVDGAWTATVKFPPELHDPLTDIVLNACIDAGVCREAN